MEFNHRAYVPGETIAAVATPPGEGGIAVIRITGNQAIQIANIIFSKDVTLFKTHTAHYGQILDKNGHVIDSVLLLIMLGTRSYAGEDTVEIHCHGGSLITRRVLETVIQKGARLAMPGEFTFKAFMNGKIDLVQAEAVQELICAKNELALDAAGAHLQGSLSLLIRSLQAQLTDIAAILEAWVDFPEEGLEFASMETIQENLDHILKEIKKLISTFHDGKILHDGISLCLIGCPNVGKSSLMNALLDKDRAIVTHIAGTTRDLLEDDFRLNGLNVRVTDTAGIRETDELIEKEGIRRSRAAMNRADLILLILDGEKGLQEQDKIILSEVPEHKTIAVWNKIDLPVIHICSVPLPHTAKISAKERLGLNELRQLIDKVIWEKGIPPKDEVFITNLRHKEALIRASEACERLTQGLKNSISPEFLSLDVRICLSELGMIIGTNVSEDILSAIFSKFCIGK